MTHAEGGGWHKIGLVLSRNVLLPERRKRLSRLCKEKVAPRMCPSRSKHTSRSAGGGWESWLNGALASEGAPACPESPACPAAFVGEEESNSSGQLRGETPELG